MLNRQQRIIRLRRFIVHHIKCRSSYQSLLKRLKQIGFHQDFTACKIQEIRTDPTIYCTLSLTCTMAMFSIYLIYHLRSIP